MKNWWQIPMKNLRWTNFIRNISLQYFVFEYGQFKFPYLEIFKFFKKYSSEIWTINLQSYSPTLYPLAHRTSWCSMEMIVVQYKTIGTDWYCHLQKFIGQTFFHRRFFIGLLKLLLKNWISQWWKTCAYTFF